MNRMFGWPDCRRRRGRAGRQRQDAAAGAKKAERASNAMVRRELDKGPVSDSGGRPRAISICSSRTSRRRRSDPDMTRSEGHVARRHVRPRRLFFRAEAGGDGVKVIRACGQGRPRRTRRCARCAILALHGQNEVPRVAGQQYDYVVKQLKDFKARHRTNDGGNMSVLPVP